MLPCKERQLQEREKKKKRFNQLKFQILGSIKWKTWSFYYEVSNIINMKIVVFLLLYHVYIIGLSNGVLR